MYLEWNINYWIQISPVGLKRWKTRKYVVNTTCSIINHSCHDWCRHCIYALAVVSLDHHDAVPRAALMHMRDIGVDAHARYWCWCTCEIFVLMHMRDIRVDAHARYSCWCTCEIFVLMHMRDICVDAHARYSCWCTCEILVLMHHYPDTSIWDIHNAAGWSNSMETNICIDLETC